MKQLPNWNDVKWDSDFDVVLGALDHLRLKYGCITPQIDVKSVNLQLFEKIVEQEAALLEGLGAQPTLVLLLANWLAEFIRKHPHIFPDEPLYVYQNRYV